MTVSLFQMSLAENYADQATCATCGRSMQSVRVHRYSVNNGTAFQVDCMACGSVETISNPEALRRLMADDIEVRRLMADDNETQGGAK